MLHQVHPQVVLRAMHLVVGTCNIAKSTLLALLTIFHRVDGPTDEKCNLYLTDGQLPRKPKVLEKNYRILSERVSRN